MLEGLWNRLTGRNTIVLWVLVTASIVSAYWKSFYQNRIDLMKQENDFLEKQNADLRESGLDSKAIKRIEDRLITLSRTLPIDPFSGTVEIGTSMTCQTEISMSIHKACDLIAERKFDLATAELNKIKKSYPSFHGISYYRFLVERGKLYIAS